MDRRCFLRLAAAGLAAPRLLAGCAGADGSAPADAGRGDAGFDSDAGETPADAGPGRKTVRYATTFTRPELRLREGAGLVTVPMEPGAGGGFVARFGTAGAAARCYFQDALSGGEDRPPGGGDYLLPADLDEAWVEKGTVFDVDPRRIPFELIDAHTHPYERASDGSLQFDAGPMLATLGAQGVGVAVTSLKGTLAEQRVRVGGMCRDNPWVVPLVWVEPQRDPVAEVEALLEADGFRGLKFHPTVSGYPADGAAMDPFLELAARRAVPVQIHSAVDDPSRAVRVAALAARHPQVKVVLVHTELGAIDKTAAIATVRALPNVYAETSWANPESVLQIMGALDSSRTLFGTDATVDGYQHFEKTSIANPQGEYVYTVPQMIARVREWAHPDAFANWARLTAVRLYGLRFGPLLGG